MCCLNETPVHSQHFQLSLLRQSLTLRHSGHSGTLSFIFFSSCAWVGRKSRWIFPEADLPCVPKVLSQLISLLLANLMPKKGTVESPTLFSLCWCNVKGHITHDGTRAQGFQPSPFHNCESTVQEFNCSFSLFISKEK